MIQLPRRSVTRFFIPLIDVLTLLFCIFLLMPYVKRTGKADGAEPGSAPSPWSELQPPGGTTPTNPDELARRVEQERQELERLRKEKMEVLQNRLAIQVLEIDADTGKLFYYGPERAEVTDEAQAHALIERQREQARGRELYYLFLFPRKATGYPEQGQLRKYERWFAVVPHGIDRPRGGPN